MDITREMQNPLFKKGFYAGFSYKLIMDEFDEDQHPRDEQGKFTTGEGTGGSSGGYYTEKYKDVYDKLTDKDKSIVDRIVKAEDKYRDATARYTMRERGAKTEWQETVRAYYNERGAAWSNSDNRWDVKMAADLYREMRAEQDVPFSGEIKDISEQINSCTSTKEVESLLQSQGYFRKYTMSDGSVYDTNKATNLKGMDVESAKSVAGVCNKLFNEIPELAGQLSGIICANGGRSKYGECMYPETGTGGIRMNNRFYDNYERLSKIYEKDVAAGYHPTGTTVEAALFHEFGHAIDNLISERIIDKGRVSDKPNFAKGFAYKLREKGYYDWQTSKYATKSDREFIAENFAEYMNSPNPRPAAKETGDYIKAGLKQWKERGGK